MKLHQKLIRQLKKTAAVLLPLCLALVCLTGLKDAQAESPSFGDDAYAFMNTFQDSFPGRASNYPILKEAETWLVEQVAFMGYEYTLQPYTAYTASGDAVSGENIIFTRPGASDRVIVVGAHYDSVLETKGTDDNASGVGVLLELAGRMSAKDGLPYTIRFILFCDEEPGCLGSQYYVSQLSEEEIGQIACMVNIDTVGAGDYMYLYGGGVNASGNPERYWAVQQALEDAKALGLEMSYHPDVNPEFPVPAKHTASDQMAFDRVGIPYVYCEASNWNGGEGNTRFTNFYQTDNPASLNGQMMHVVECENLGFYQNTFGSRFIDHLRAYTRLLDYFLENFREESDSGLFRMNSASTPAVAKQPLNIRSFTSIASERLGQIPEGATATVTGYNAEWCKINYQGLEGYVKTEFLEISAPIPEDTPAPSTASGDEEGSYPVDDEELEGEGGSDAPESVPETELSSEAEAVTVPAQKTSEMVFTVGDEDGAQEKPEEKGGSLPAPGSSSDAKTKITDLLNDPAAVRIMLIAVIAIICLWISILVAMKQHKSSVNRKKDYGDDDDFGDDEDYEETDDEEYEDDEDAGYDEDSVPDDGDYGEDSDYVYEDEDEDEYEDEYEDEDEDYYEDDYPEEEAEDDESDSDEDVFRKKGR